MRIRVTNNQQKYVDSLPFHESQRMVERNDEMDYAIFEYQKERWRKMQEILRTRTPLSAELLRAQSKRLAELVEKERNKSRR